MLYALCFSTSLPSTSTNTARSPTPNLNRFLASLGTVTWFLVEILAVPNTFSAIIFTCVGFVRKHLNNLSTYFTYGGLFK